jgi:uncharacterized heparinase superfamily protein
LENGLALACAGAVCTGVEADAWWRAGVALLNWQLPLQFLPDGGHVERSGSYHLALTSGLLETIDLSDASHRPLPSEWRDLAGRAIAWASAVRAPDATYPLFNDAATDAAPALDDVLDLAAALGIGGASCDLSATGWLRHSVGGAMLFVDAAPDADGWQPGHAHADGLTFELWIDGERTVVDFGVGAYGTGQARQTTRATRSHNTVEYDGLDSCEVWGGFRVGRRGRARTVRSERRSESAHVELEHDGYSHLPECPRHRRTMTLSSRALSIEDTVEGGQAGTPYVSRLRFDTSAFSRLKVTAGGAVRQSDDVWHLRHGEPRPAVVLEQRGNAGRAPHVRWRIEW